MLPAGSPLDLVANETLRNKMQEPLNLLGKQRFANIDIRVRAKGGGHVSQAYGEQGHLLCQLPTHGHSLLAGCSDSSSGASAVCTPHSSTQRHGRAVMVCLPAVLLFEGRQSRTCIHSAAMPHSFLQFDLLLLKLAGSDCPPMATS